MGSPHSFITLLPVFAILLLLLCAPSANGAITNTTVDDTSSAFTFTGSWTAVSASNPCDFCSSKPDASQTVGASWHDGNYRTGASETTGGSFTFTGSAVYIFGIDQAKSQPDIVFTLGSTQSTHHYTGTEQFAYNALFFSATGLAADQTHTVNWIFNIDQSTGVGVQAALFDYAIVTSGTVDVTPQAQKPSTSTTKAQGKIASPTPSSSSTSSSSKPTANGQTLAGAAAASPSSSSAKTGATQSKSSGIALSATSVPSADTLPNTSSGASGASASGLTTPAAAISSDHSKSNTGAIVGAVVSVLICAVLALIVFLLCRRRRRRQARADEERRAAGLSPAPPRMRRVRGGPVLQPFVEDRPPDAPAGNVFASGPFATASSAAAAAGAARRANAFGPPAGAGSASDAHVAGAGTGTGTFLTPSASAAGSAAPPPAFVGGAATLGIYPSEKTPEIAYTNQQPQPGPSQQVSRQPSQSSQSDASTSRIDTTDKQREMERERERETALSPSTSALISPSTTTAGAADTTSARERYLEQRLATLEAHVASYLPPPYEQPDP